MLEVGCVHLNAYGMPKQKAGVVLSTFEGMEVDWGTVTGAALREGSHAFQSGKKLRPIIQRYFTVLFPPRTLPAPATWPRRRRLEEIATSTWEDDTNSRPAASPSRRRPPSLPAVPSSTPIAALTLTPREETEEQRTSPQPKRRRLDRKNGKILAKDTTRPIVTLISESYAQEEFAFTGNTVHGKGTLIPDNKVIACPTDNEVMACPTDNEVMACPKIPDLAHEFATRLQFGTTFEVMEFLAGQQIKLS